MIYTLEQLSNGEVACINNGTLEQMIAVLKHCFPNDNCQINGTRDYYFASNLKGMWNGSENVKLCGIPTQSVVEFYKQLQPQFEIGCWYESKGSNGLFIKVKSLLENGSTNKTDTIWSSGEFTENTDYRNIIQNWTKLEDLSLIQSFLPSNHPDFKIMNKQYLTRKQLIELHKADSCTEWKDNIEDILNSRLTPFSLDSDKINIDNFYINLVNSRCNAHQKQLLLNFGIKLSNEIAVCNSKDGDCVKISSTYYVNRGGFVSIFQYNALQELQIRSTDYVKVFSPDIVGELIKEPLSFKIKIN